MADSHAEKYPEHAKARAVKRDSQVIGEFLEEMGTRGYELCTYDRHHAEYEPQQNIEKVLAEYFGIDQAKLEQERLAMLAEVRGDDISG